MRRHELVAALQEAGREVAFPQTPPLAEGVRRRIEAGPIPVAAIRLPRTRPPRLRPALGTIAVVTIALAVTMSFSVTARRAVADLLGVVGIRVSFDDEPSVTPRPASSVPLGERLSRSAAGESAGLPVLVPTTVSGPPAFYYDPSVGESGMVSVVYPRSARTLAGVDLLVGQFRAALEEEYVKKVATLGSKVRFVPVRASDGYWIGGEPHLFFYVDADGEVRQDSARLAGRVLIWEEGGVTYRIEGAESLRAALRIASDLR